MANAPKDGSLRQELSKLWKDGTFRVLVLLTIVIVGHFVIQEALVIILKTEYALHTPISGSMEPTLKIGDLLIIQGGLRMQDIYAHPGNGDIIIFRDPRNPSGIPIVHRAINKVQEGDKWYLVTKGDANAYDDYSLWGWKIYEENVLGRVIAHIPVLGSLLRLLDETKVNIGGYAVTLRMMIIIILIAAIFVLEFLGSPETAEEPREKEETGKKVKNSQ